MMFLQFFIWGGWFVTLGTFLGNNLNASGGQIAMAFSTQSWGAIIAPVFIGLIADRYFNAEKNIRSPAPIRKWPVVPHFSNRGILYFLPLCI